MGNWNPNYFEKKAGSLEEAILNAVNGVKTQINEAKVVMDLENDDPKLMKDIKKFGLKVKDLGDSGNAGYNEYEISGPQSKIDAASKKLNLQASYGEKLDPVNKDAAKKKFDDRKDKDIDNDGDVDSSDKFLHKRRKAIGKAMQSEAVGKDIAKKMMGSKTMKSFASKVAKMKSVTKGDLEKMLPDYVDGADISKLFEAQDGGDFKPHMMYDPKTGKGYMANKMDDHLRMKKMGYDHKKPKMEAYELGTDEYTNHTKKMTPGQFESQGKEAWNEISSNIQKKQTSMREALAKVWGMDEGKSPFESFAKGDQKMKEKKDKVPKGFHRMPDGSLMKNSDMGKKENKTMTGKAATKVSVDPDMEEKMSPNEKDKYMRDRGMREKRK